MALSMHAASAPIFTRILTAMLTWLDKAEAHAESRKFDSANYLNMRLAPDMLPFVKQVQIASDHAKGCIARLAGIEVPSYADDESSIAELRTRIRKTIDFIATVGAERVDGSEGREVVLTVRAGTLKLNGQDYLTQRALPNFFFHATTTYALLRHAGVDVGKADFIGK